MKILAWNCRGLGNPQTCKTLKHLIRIHLPNILFLSETKGFNMNKVYKNLLDVGTLTNIHTVNCSVNGKGKVGG